MKANFLRHEGFLGAVGAFLKVHPMAPTSAAATQGGREPRKVRGDYTTARWLLHHDGLTLSSDGAHIRSTVCD